MRRKALAVGAVASGLLLISTPAGALTRPQIIWGPGGVAITVPSTCPPGAYVPCSWLGYMNEPNVPKTVGLGPIPPGFTFDIIYPDFCGVLQADALYRVNGPTPLFALGGYWELSYGTRNTVSNCTPPTTTTTEPSTTTTTVAPTTTTTVPVTTTTQAPVTTTTQSTLPPYLKPPPSVPPAAPVVPPKPTEPIGTVPVTQTVPQALTGPQLPFTGAPVLKLLSLSAILIALGVVLLKYKRVWKTHNKGENP